MFNLGSLGGLFVSLGVDTAQFEGDMGKAASIAERQAQRIEEVAGAIGTTVAAGAAAAAGAIALMIKNTIDAADGLSKMSTRTGFTVERLSELQYAAQLSDVSFDSLKTSLGTFSKAMADAANPTSKQSQLFQALGVDISQGVQPAFDQFIQQVQKLPNQEAKVAAMRTVFGRAGESILQMADGMDEAAESARKLGIVISADLARQSEQFNDNMTKLGASSKALAITWTGDLIGSLAALSDNLVKAAERGEKFKGILTETSRIMAVMVGNYINVPGMTDLITKFFVNTDETGYGGVKGLIKGPDGQPINQGGGDVNPAMAACAVSGGKWVNGQCVYGKQHKAPDRSLMVGRQINEGMEQEAKDISDAAAATDKYNEAIRQREYYENMLAGSGMDLTNMTTADIKDKMDAWLKSIDAENEAYDQRARMAAGFDEQGKAIQQNLKDQKSLAHDLGLTFQSAFEDAVINGKKFSDVLKGIEQDIARIILRKAITEPLGNAVAGAMSPISSGIGSFISNLFKADGGPVAAGQSYIVGERGPELFTPGASGAITPNHALMGAGGDSTHVNVTFNVGSLDPRTAAHVIAQNIPMIAGVLRKAAAARGNGTPF